VEAGMSAQNLSALDQLSELAELFGPFFFALLFVLFVTRTSYNFYMRALARDNPPAPARDLSIMRGNFIATVVVSLLLVALSIGWWFYYQTRGSYIYQIAITGLNSNIQIDSAYFRKLTNRPMSYSGPISDDFFIIVSDHPFKKGQKFEFQVWISPAQPVDSTSSSSPCGVNLQTPQSSKVSAMYHGSSIDTYELKMLPGRPPELVLASENSSESLATTNPPKSSLQTVRLEIPSSHKKDMSHDE
jgi:hypothetical protein